MTLFSDVVLRKEGDWKGQYERFGAEAGIADLNDIFTMLSEDEKRHADALHALETGGRVDLAHSSTLDGARRILRRLSMKDKALSGFRGDLHSFIAAMDFEAASARACGELAREASHGWERELFQKIAEEDEIHFTLLEQLRELLESVAVAGGGDLKDVH
ncbi:ferritin [Geomonas sp.]|uniref:ferritin n=1 Tax=Geomonas sp. TaxID=2651584 RepID=UPI002B49AD43|nr:ferritin [Geomonas sp.]HJV35176.1 ferritin [Geomonas sp.]